MKKHNKLDLAYYSLFAGVGVLSISAGDISYTDISDITVDPDAPHAEIDIDNDGDFDIEFNITELSATHGSFSEDINIQLASINAMPGASFMASYYLTFWHDLFDYYVVYSANNVGFGSPINDSYIWRSFNPGGEIGYFDDIYFYGMLGAQVITESGDGGITISYPGNFNGMENQYAGVRLNIAGQPHFGWIRLSVSEDRTITIHDFAYESDANTTILAGDMGEVVCETPVTSGASAFPTSAKVMWEPMDDVETFQVKYRPVGGGAWLNKNVDGSKSSKILTGLSCSTTYEWKIRAKCGDDNNSDYSPISNFTTGACRLDGSPELTGIDVYPNPSTEFLSVSAEEFTSDVITVEIFNLTGEKIISFSTSDKVILVNVEALA